MCKDGTSTSAASKSGACSGHGGVKEWYGAAGAMAAPAAMSKAAPAAAAAPAKTTSYTPPATPAPGGGQGQVWVNKPSKVYHCPGDQWYGKTKDGAYMSEANALAQGYRADHGKACQ
jgi:type IV secretory pathway TrbL component